MFGGIFNIHKSENGATFVGGMAPELARREGGRLMTIGAVFPIVEDRKAKSRQSYRSISGGSPIDKWSFAAGGQNQRQRTMRRVQ